MIDRRSLPSPSSGSNPSPPPRDLKVGGIVYRRPERGDSAPVLQRGCPHAGKRLQAYVLERNRRRLGGAL